jgi:hypothetical protein
LLVTRLFAEESAQLAVRRERAIDGDAGGVRLAAKLREEFVR